jgi:hypothetical protein
MKYQYSNMKKTGVAFSNIEVVMMKKSRIGGEENVAARYRSGSAEKLAGGGKEGES